MKYSKELKDLGELSKTKKITHIIRKGTKLRDLLILETWFLPENENCKNRLYYVINDIFERVKCPKCQTETGIKCVKNKYIIKFCSFSCNVTHIDPITGSSKSKYISNKTKNNLSQIDSETGLSGYQKLGLKTKETLSQIDPETELTGYQKLGLKTKETLSQIDPETELTGYQLNRRRQILTMSKINLITNLTYIKESTNSKVFKMSQVNPNTGLSKYDEIKLKNKKQNSIINPNTGLSKYDEIKLKVKNTMSKINPNTGLSKYDEIHIKSIKSIKTRKTNFYKKLKNLQEYSINTTLTEYLSNQSKIISITCKKCLNIFKCDYQYIRCTKCYPYNKSMGENEVLEFCESLGTVPESNTRSIIPPLELDIYIPDYNLAIEYDGLFWHSSHSTESENKNYHLIKTQECEKQGIHLFHIFENEWTNPVKQKIWKSIIRNRLGQSDRIFARKTSIKLVASKDKTEFLNNNHLQGNCNSSVNLGLYLGDELVSLMTFGRSRYNKKIDWELLRFCNRIGYSVVGGASRLLEAFRNDNFGSIISYADKRRSNGNLYDKLRFELSHESGPNYFYYNDPMVLESRIQYQKHKLRDKLNVFDPNLTESENMYNNGYRKIYDCGNQVWILN